MFDNIGGKIKTVAKVICWLGIIASVIMGIIMIKQATGRYYNNDEMVIAGIATIIGGSLLSWIGSFFTYGFGQLIENSESIKNYLARKSD